MGHEISSLGQVEDSSVQKGRPYGAENDEFVLEKSIFSNVFEKDIRRVFIYKKAERLAKAVHLISPAFSDTPALHARIDAIGMALVDAAIQPSGVSRTKLARELLALSSALSIARTSGLLSAMNADLIDREVQSLLQEVAAYEEPRVFLDDAPTLATLAKSMQQSAPSRVPPHQKSGRTAVPVARPVAPVKDTQKDIKTDSRRDAIVEVIKAKKRVSIKDISTHFRDISEKTIQRELLSLVAQGTLIKEGERRWSTYVLA